MINDLLKIITIVMIAIVKTANSPQVFPASQIF